MKALVGAFNQEKALVGAFSVIVQPVVEPMDRFAALVFSKRIYIGSGAGYSRQRLQSTTAAAGRVLHISTFPDGLAAPSLESNVQTFCGKHRALIGPDRLILPPHWPLDCGRHFGKLCFCPDDCAAKVGEFKHCPTHQKARDRFMNYIILSLNICEMHCNLHLHRCHDSWKATSETIILAVWAPEHDIAPRTMLHAVKVLLTGYIGLQPGSRVRWSAACSRSIMDLSGPPEFR